jgi:hypothetical protein
MNFDQGVVLPAIRRLSKPIFVLAAVAVLALAISACTSYKPGSFSLSQPGEIGNVRVHLVICSKLNAEVCSENTGEAENQSLLAIAAPKGAVAPATITATPLTGGPTITFTRNDQVAQDISEASQGGEEPWPPAGTEGFGYLSNVFLEEKGIREWSVDADFGLPPTSDGGAYAGPFSTSVWTGSRLVGEFSPGENAGPGDRPVHCYRGGGSGEPPQESDAGCEFVEADSLGTSDLRIKAPSASAAPGAQATLQFGLDFASTASSLPSFKLAATTTLPQAGLNLGSATFSPAAPDPGTGRSALSLENVTVSVPATAQPGTYDVTLTATTGAGASVSQVGKLEVKKPQSPPQPPATVKLGKVKLNKAKGTATLPVSVSGAGTLTVSGKGVVMVQRKASGSQTIKVTIKARGKAKKKLTSTGKAKVKAKFAFQPSSGAAVTMAKSITLKKKLP